MNTHIRIASLLALATGLAVTGTPVAAQTQPDSATVTRAKPHWTIGSLNLQVGTAHLGISELNQTMTANSRPTFATDVASIGLAGYARFGRIVLGGTGETALPERKVAGGFINKIWFGSASIDLGYALIDKPRFLVYPQASFGIRSTELDIARDGDYSYSAGVTDPSRGVTMRSWSMLAGYGLAAELRFETRVTGQFSLGLRGGYATPLGDAHTSAGESSVSGSPSENAGGYLRLSVGKPIGKRRDALGVLSTVLIPLIR